MLGFLIPRKIQEIRRARRSIPAKAPAALVLTRLSDIGGFWHECYTPGEERYTMNTVWKIIRGSEYSLRAGALALWDSGLPRLPRQGGVLAIEDIRLGPNRLLRPVGLMNSKEARTVVGTS